MVGFDFGIDFGIDRSIVVAADHNSLVDCYSLAGDYIVLAVVGSYYSCRVQKNLKSRRIDNKGLQIKTIMFLKQKKVNAFFIDPPNLVYIFKVFFM